MTSAVRVDFVLILAKEALPPCFYQICIRVERGRLSSTSIEFSMLQKLLLSVPWWFDQFTAL